MAGSDPEQASSPDNSILPDYPEPIADTPENIARAILSTPPKKSGKWRYTRRKTAR